MNTHATLTRSFAFSSVPVFPLFVILAASLLMPSAALAEIRVNVDDRVVVQFEKLKRDTKGEHRAQVQVTNISGADLHAPLRLVITEFKNDKYRLANPDGVDTNGIYIEIELGGDSLPLGATSPWTEIRFNKPKSVKSQKSTKSTKSTKSVKSVKSVKAQKSRKSQKSQKSRKWGSYPLPVKFDFEITAATALAPTAPRSLPFALQPATGVQTVKFRVNLQSSGATLTSPLFLRNLTTGASPVEMRDDGVPPDNVLGDNIYFVNQDIDTDPLLPGDCWTYVSSIVDNDGFAIDSDPYKLCVTSFPIGAGTSDTSEQNQVVVQNAPAVADQVVIYTEDGVSEAQLLALLKPFGGVVIGALVQDNAYQVKLPQALTAGQLLALIDDLQKSPIVVFAKPNLIGKFDTVDDTDFVGLLQHSLELVAADDRTAPSPRFTWDADGADANGITVTIIDSGIQGLHPDLDPSRLGGDLTDLFNHGTQMAGIIGAASDNATGIASIAQQVSIESIKISDVAPTEFDMKSGLSTAVAASTSGVVLLAFSNAGGLFPESGLCAKIGELIAGGAVVVGSAGNEAALQASDPNIDIWPARCNDPALDSILNDYSSMITGVPEVLVEKQHYIVVGASSCNSGACASDSRLAVSSFGSWIDLSAPGNAVRTTGNASNYTNGSGTSPAAAFVAGSAAVLRGCGVAATSVASTLTTGSVGADKAVSGLPNRINLYDSLASLNTNPTGVTLGGSMTIDENVNTGAGGGFTVGGLSTVDSTVCDSHSYMILPGGDAGFSIGGSNSDQLVLNAGVLNFEAKSSYSVTVRSTDFFGGTPFDQPITINVVDLNEPPSIAATARSIDENSANGTSVGTPIPASDPDATTGVLSYAITGGNTGGAFTINNSGQLSVLNSAALDFETTPVFNLTVQVTDNGTPGLTDSAVVTVTLNDVAEGIGEPVVQLVSRFSNPPIPDGQKVTCLVDPETLESSATCPVVVYNGITYWAYSYIDNRVAMNIVGYDAADNIVQQTNKDGLRYIVTIDVDTDNQVITFTGQVSNTATMTYSSESLLLIP